MKHSNIITIIIISFSCILFLLITYKLLNVNSFKNIKIKKKKIKKVSKTPKKVENYHSEFNKLRIRDELRNELRDELRVELRDELKETLRNDLKDMNVPEKTHEEYSSGIPINIETRERAEDFKQLGICTKITNMNTNFNTPGNNDDSIILPLWGKRLYKRSNNWNYYLISDRNNYRIPVNIDNKECADINGCRELLDNDIINVPEYNGQFKVKLYKIENPKYIPYV